MRKQRHDIWKESELEIIRQNYGKTLIENWMHLLPRRTYNAIRLRARKIKARSKLRGGGMVRRCLVIDNFFSVPNPTNCYWAGFIAADGSIGSGYRRRQLAIALKITDREHLEAFRDAIAPGKRICDYRNGGYMSCKFVVNSELIVRDLFQNFRIGPRKSKTLESPPLDEPSLIESFVAGYIDGDGSITKDGQMIRMVGTEMLLSWIKKYMDTHYSTGRQIISGLQYNRRCPEIYEYSFGKSRAYGILETIAEYKLPVLARKWGRLSCQTVSGTQLLAL